MDANQKEGLNRAEETFLRTSNPLLWPIDPDVSSLRSLICIEEKKERHAVLLCRSDKSSPLHVGRAKLQVKKDHIRRTGPDKKNV